MKAEEITQATIQRMAAGSFDFGRINFPNGDMVVGHTGDLEAATVAVEVMDLMLTRIIAAAKAHNITLVVTADHGNCDTMFDQKEKTSPTGDPHL